MSTGGLFILLTNDGKQDRILQATDLLQKRLRSITQARMAAGLQDTTPTLLDIERSHVLFMTAHFKPFAAIGYEYNKVPASSPVLGSEIIFSIPQFGDFFNDMVLYTRFNELTYESAADDPNKDSFHYCDFPGERLIQNTKFDVNGNPLDEYPVESYALRRQTQVQPNKQDGYFRMVGQELPHQAYLEQQTPVQPNLRVGVEVYDGYQTPKGAHPALEVFSPLMFWFNDDPRLSIPSVAIPYGQRFIRVQLAQSNQLVELVATAGADNSDTSALGNLTIRDCTLYINNIFVNPEVHDIFIRRIGFSLIRVHKIHRQQVSQSTGNILLQSLKWPIENMTVCFNPVVNTDTSQIVDDHPLYSRYGGKGTLQNYYRCCQVTFTSEDVPGVQTNKTYATADTEVQDIIDVADVGGTAQAQVDAYDAAGPFTTQPAFDLLAAAAFAAQVTGASSATVFAAVQAAAAARIEVNAFLAVAEPLPGVSAAAQLALYTPLSRTSDPASQLYDHAVAASQALNATGFTVWQAVQLSGYSVHPVVEGNCARVEIRRCAKLVDQITVTAHGIPIYNDFPAEFFTDYTTYTYGGHNLRTPSDIGIHFIPFNLYPGSYQPSGHLNLSRAREVYFKYACENNQINPNAPAEFFNQGSAINFLLISDGSAVLRYTT